MTELYLDRLKHVWCDASDTDVARALSAPGDYVPEPYGIIQGEARRRGMQVVDPHAFALPDPAASDAHKSSLVGFARSNPFVSGCLAGVLLRWGLPLFVYYTVLLHWTVASVIYVVVCSATLCVICWPLRRMRTVLVAASAAYVGAIIGSLFLYVQVGFLRGTAWKGLVLDITLNNSAVWGIVCLLHCGAVRLHNTLWPVYEPGHCVNCGYNLRGLPEPRCPECGQPFDGPYDEVSAQPSVQQPPQ